MITSPPTFVIGVIIVLVVVWDAFEVVILPRRVTRRFRLSRFFYRNFWRIWRSVAGLIRSKKHRESAFGIFGPISLLILVGVWAVGLVFGFALMQYGSGSAVNVAVAVTNTSFWTDAYLSGTTFFTLGLGDVVPRSSLARALIVVEAGLGFGFLAAVIGYLPFIFGSFASREVSITLLDSRAGTPPTAGELLRRHSYPRGLEAVRELLKEWELWSAQLMESHLSYPVLAYFRSQHDNQSWIASLTAILDTCSLVMIGIDGACERQAQLTFAIARHAVVDLSQVFLTSPKPLPEDRLPASVLRHIRSVLAEHGLKLHEGEALDARLIELRGMYEPYIFALASHLHQTLPPWIPEKQGKDNWQTTAWGQAAGLIEKPQVHVADDHF
jgi:hypothetical protein